MRRASILLLPILFALGGCARIPDGGGHAPAGAAAVVSPGMPDQIASVISAPRPRAGANTVEALDTATEAQRAAARAAPSGTAERLGEQTASLGDPTDPGIWMRTSLVSARQPGRVEVAETGTGATVELIPLEGEGGAQLSLSAMRLLEVPLTDLPTVIIYRQ